MKKTTEIATNTAESTSQLTDQEINEMENDELWNLLDQADSPLEASAMFSRNVVREIRLLDDNVLETNTHTLWHRIISSNFAKYGLGVAVAAGCAFLITVMTPNSSTINEGSLTNTKNAVEPSTQVALAVSEDAFTAEILEIADQDPLFMSEEDIDLAMNF